jgi:hypothetical protein
MIVAGACGVLGSRGASPFVLESLMYPGAAERNQEALEDWHRRGVPFVTSE